MNRTRILAAVAVLALGGLTACQPAAFDVIRDDSGGIVNGKGPITVVLDDPTTPVVEDAPEQPPVGGPAPAPDAVDEDPEKAPEWDDAVDPGDGTAPIYVPPGQTITQCDASGACITYVCDGTSCTPVG